MTRARMRARIVRPSTIGSWRLAGRLPVVAVTVGLAAPSGGTGWALTRIRSGAGAVDAGGEDHVKRQVQVDRRRFTIEADHPVLGMMSEPGPSIVYALRCMKKRGRTWLLSADGSPIHH